MGLKLLLVVLINPQFSQLKLSLLVFSQKSHFLLLALQVSLVLFNKSVFIFLQLDLALLILAILFFTKKLLLLLLMFTEHTLCLCLKLLLVIENLLAEHRTTVLVLHFDVMLKLSKLSFILALFLPLKLQNFSIRFFLHFAL